MLNVIRLSPLGLMAALIVSTASDAGATALLVPAYFSPDDDAADWTQLTSAASKVSVTAIFNPNSGPGNAADPAYTSALTAFRAAGGQALAYVHTQKPNGTLRSLSSVEADVDKYRSFYTFDGVFVDEMTDDSNAADVSFYTNLYNYIKNENPAYTVVGNPGTNVPQAYTAAADVLVTYEDTSAKYTANMPDAWTQSAPASGFAHIVYEASASSLGATLKQATSQNAGYFYATDDGADGNPYDSLPSYWTTEVNAVAVPEPACGAMAIAGIVLMGRRNRVKD